MNRTLLILPALLTLAGGPAAAQKTCEEFEELLMTLEQNATDGDTEVVFLAKTEEEGLRRLSITAPNGRRVARFKGDKRSIGIREFADPHHRRERTRRDLRSARRARRAGHGRGPGPGRPNSSRRTIAFQRPREPPVRHRIVGAHAGHTLRSKAGGTARFRT